MKTKGTHFSTGPTTSSRHSKMARLISCTTLDEMDQLFTSLCILCLSRVKYLEIEQYCEKLQNAVYNFDENYEFEMEYLSEIDEELPNEIGDSITYRKESPFGT